MNQHRTAVAGDRLPSDGSSATPKVLPSGRRFTKTNLLAALFLLPVLLAGQPAHSLPAPEQQAVERDGQHDFDFNVGTWHTHIRRILNPLSGGTHSVELNGIVTVRKVWGGRAQLEEIEADGPNGHWEGMTLFLYNPQSRQWGQWFLNSKTGTPGTPLIGAFHDGHGELFSQDTSDGKGILVRGTWSDITPEAHRYEEDYSSDGGKTWLPAFMGDLTRDSSPKPEAPAGSDLSANIPAESVAHDFDFDFGTWKTHSSRLLHPLTGSTTWVEMDGATSVEKVWGGRANLAVFKANGPSGELELLGLRWYSPDAHQWNVDFATPKVGMLGIPAVGEFKNGRGDFYDYEEINGKFVMVRFSIWGITPETAQSEQAFSADGGKTWEVNWINRYTRARGE